MNRFFIDYDLKVRFRLRKKGATVKPLLFLNAILSGGTQRRSPEQVSTTYLGKCALTVGQVSTPYLGKCALAVGQVSKRSWASALRQLGKYRRTLAQLRKESTAYGKHQHPCRRNIRLPYQHLRPCRQCKCIRFICIIKHYPHSIAIL